MVDSSNVSRGRTLGLVLIVLLIAGATYAQGNGWSKWRGPDGTGISAETKWNPASLSKGPKFAWKKDIGPGYSAISVQGSYAFTMGYENEKDVVLCLRTKDGSEVWRHSYACKLGKYQGPRATPVVDGKLLYTLSQQGHLFCFDALHPAHTHNVFDTAQFLDFVVLRDKGGF